MRVLQPLCHARQKGSVRIKGGLLRTPAKFGGCNEAWGRIASNNDAKEPEQECLDSRRSPPRTSTHKKARLVLAKLVKRR